MRRELEEEDEELQRRGGFTICSVLDQEVYLDVING
jgi:hypothetical protein